MFYWIISILLFFCFIKVLFFYLFSQEDFFGKKVLKQLEFVENLLREFEETFSIGLIPQEKRWNLLDSMPPPWYPLIKESIFLLRDSGCSLVPTLKRMRELVIFQKNSFTYGKAKSSQALAQAFICLCFVPFLGFSLYCLLPELKEKKIIWIGCCLFFFFLSCLGALWIFFLSLQARWGGLSPGHRIWVLASQCAGELFLASVRSGVPPDNAWRTCCLFLGKPEFLQQGPDLGKAWGYSLWDVPHSSSLLSPESKIIQFGQAIKKAIQVSLLEGRPCLDRVESELCSLKIDWTSHIEKYCQLLPMKTLKPLFLCIAPALFGLLASGFWIFFQFFLEKND